MKPPFLSAFLVSLALLCGTGAALLLSGCGPSASTAHSEEEQLYTCSMHPQIISKKPGNCPICGMKLTPILKKSGSNAPSSAISIDPVTLQNMDLRTARVTRGPLRRTVRTVGMVDFDETAITDVTTKFKGWVEVLHVDATGQLVHRGDPLFEIYSPELYSAQVEYLLALDQAGNTTGTASSTLKASALEKLKYFDIPDDQIAEIEKTHQPRKALRINAPRDGIVVEKDVVQGQMVDAGMRLYRLADLGTVWVQSQIYEQDLPFVKPGEPATVSLSYLQDRKFRGRVTYIYPTVDDKTRTVRVRMEFHNPGYFLKPGMYATVELQAELSPSALLVPDMAILRSGQKNTVFVALEGGHFEARSVVLGPRAEGDSYQVISGLNEGERIVTSGQFMLDSESQLREALQKLNQPPAPEEAAEKASSASNSSAEATEAEEKTVYICPMPEHVALQYDHPGKCPLCGMSLVPVSQDLLDKIQPGGKVDYYTCPMPQDSDIHQNHPGKCPRCGMTLIPVMSQPQPAQAQAPRPALPKTLYTCPMPAHADVVQDKPGECPKCGMDLVETSTVSHGKIAEQHWLEQHSGAHPAKP